MFDIILAVAFTHHLGLQGDYNEIHPHIQLQHDSGFVAGAYYNSEDAMSAYAGWRFDDGPVFLEIGAVTGYAGIDVAPFFRAGVEIGENMDIFVTPAYEISNDGSERIGAVVGVSLKF